MKHLDSEAGDILYYLQLNSVFYCKSQLQGDWGVDLPPMPGTAIFHIVLAGSCVAEYEGNSLQLKAGDFLFVSKGQGHVLKQNASSEATGLFELERKQIGEHYETLTIEGSGETVTMLCGVVSLQHPSAEFLIDAMPPFIYIECAKSPLSSWMSQTVRLISEEAENNRIGGETVLTRLADVLVVQALRKWVEEIDHNENSWLSALNDKQIGQALRCIHATPGQAWTLENLGRRVGMSRTAFATRFTKLVGEPMLQYLTRWRMNLAAMRIRNGEKVTPEMIEELGYQSESSFRRTFKKTMGKTISELSAMPVTLPQY